MSTNPIQTFNEFKRLARPGSRFGYFPPVSMWSVDKLDSEVLKESYSSLSGNTSLYFHIPFCEQLCSFCGCNIKVTPTTESHSPYVTKLLAEWKGVASEVETDISNIHLGGGTPNFLSSKDLDTLLSESLSFKKLTSNFYGAVEVDPRLLTTEKVKILEAHRFSKAILGVQDFDQKVLQNVNRTQSFDDVCKASEILSQNNFEDISLEFIYGLPFQTVQSFVESVGRATELPINGIILYPLALAPWQKGTQSALGHFPEPDLELNFTMYREARDLLLSRGFIHFGFGHFYKADNPLIASKEDGSLSRNITGFKKSKSDSLLSFGVSAISHLPGLHLQNQRIFEKYQFQSGKELLTERHHMLSPQQLFFQDFTREIICTHKISQNLLNQYEEIFERSTDPVMNILKHNNLIELEQITPKGVDVLKSICLEFLTTS
ncbi:MAG: radical SAM protein [Bacteriovoracaceae bacterium]|nr:radical SAM protein [Bacteriovoracaceae bacterium]